MLHCQCFEGLVLCVRMYWCECVTAYGLSVTDKLHAVQVVDCGRFWAQNADENSCQLLNSIQAQLQQYVATVRSTV